MLLGCYIYGQCNNRWPHLNQNGSHLPGSWNAIIACLVLCSRFGWPRTRTLLYIADQDHCPHLTRKQNTGTAVLDCSITSSIKVKVSAFGRALMCALQPGSDSGKARGVYMLNSEWLKAKVKAHFIDSFQNVRQKQKFSPELLVPSVLFLGKQ